MSHLSNRTLRNYKNAFCLYLLMILLHGEYTYGISSRGFIYILTNSDYGLQILLLVVQPQAVPVLAYDSKW